MHLRKITFLPDEYPSTDCYPFNLHHLNVTGELAFDSTITFFVGENASGKSTLLRAIARRCGIHIWDSPEHSRVQYNKYEKDFYRYIKAEWINGAVPGSFFCSAIFEHFTKLLDDWASGTPRLLDYFGGKSLMAQSHGQSHMSYFESRYKIKGLYLLDEPETALSPKTQIQFLRMLNTLAREGCAQFIIATHSPILMAASPATIYSFDHSSLQQIAYEDTNHYKIYNEFLNNRGMYLTEECI